MVSHSNYSPGRLFFSVFLSLCFGSSLCAQFSNPSSGPTQPGLGGANSIVGTVFGPGGHQVSRPINVRLQAMTRGDKTTTTDRDGNFAFRDLPSGTYTVFIDKEPDFEPFSQQTDIIQLRGAPPQVQYLNIRLKAKASTDAKPGVINADFANVPKSALALYTKALELAKKGNHKEAIEQFKLSISEYPDFMLAFNEVGIQHLRLNELEKADEAFRSALKIKPDAFAPLINRGILLVRMKRFDEAEKVLRGALKLKDQSDVGHYFLGQALFNLGRSDEAEKELVAAVTLGGDKMKEAHRFLSIIYSDRGDKKRAADELETYLRLAPTAPDAEQLRNTLRQLKGLEAPPPPQPEPPAPTPSSATKP